MQKQTGITLFAFVSLTQGSPVPLFQQLDTQIRTAILSGRLPSGLRLPSSRALAIELGVSRTTVLTAFEQLVAEGFLESRVGAGTYVSANITEQIIKPPLPNEPSNEQATSEIVLSKRGTLIAKNRSDIQFNVPTAFLPHQPAYDEFPYNVWARIAARRLRNPSGETLNYGNPQGHLPLRRAIAAYLLDARGIKCDEAQIVVVAGAQMAMSLTSLLLLDPGDEVIMEDPCYIAMREQLISFGARIINAPVDKNGMKVSIGIQKAPRARMALITPSHQYPLGVTLSLSRRLELLSWANQNKSWIVEDDYDSEFRFSGSPMTPLRAIDRNERVIYIGTFSKALFPSLRIGYLVVPPGLVDAYSAAVHLLTHSISTLTQEILTEFIDEGYFSKHIRRMRLIYAERQNALVDTIHSELGGYMNMSPTQAGMNVIGWLPSGSDDTIVRQKIKEYGILSTNMSYYHNEQQTQPGLYLGFCCTPIDKMLPAVQTMAKALGV